MVSDYGFREYTILRTRVLAASNHVDIAAVAARITKFVQDEDVNPVYAETVVNLLMAHGYKVISEVISGVDGDTYARMATHLIARHVGTTADVWRRTMDGNHEVTGTTGV